VDILVRIVEKGVQPGSLVDFLVAAVVRGRFLGAEAKLEAVFSERHDEGIASRQRRALLKVDRLKGVHGSY
jgi:hypothetical protein